MSLTIYRAAAADRFDVLRLLSERARWLREKGSRQWAGDLLAPERIASIVARGGTFLAVREDGKLAGTITVSAEGDPDFWTRAELLEPAWYISKMATSLAHGRGLGAPMLRWAVDRAAQAGMTWCRLDVLRDDSAAPLRAWYAAQGWEHLRDAVVPGKNSGALFRRPAAADLEAREMFSGSLPWLERPRRVIAPGTRVMTGSSEKGTVAASPAADSAEVPLRQYAVELDSGEVIGCRETDIAVLLDQAG